MRVIAGEARSLPLKTPQGLDTRPTTDRIKETLFNMLQPYLPCSVFIDLCSGSGGIGIEAISRGARHAYFVENGREPAKCIAENLRKICRLTIKSFKNPVDNCFICRVEEKKSFFCAEKLCFCLT